MDIEKAKYIMNVVLSDPEMPMQLSKLIACQSAFETNNWTNNNFIKNNNGFGYKQVIGGRFQLAKGGIHSTESDNYAAYATFEDSIKEICAWIKRRQKEGKFPSDLVTIQFPENYAYLLKSCGYYGGLETDYVKGIEMYFEKLNNNLV